jgi:hypothetical protein
MKRWSIYRSLEIHPECDDVKKELERPLILLVSSWRTEGHQGAVI